MTMDGILTAAWLVTAALLVIFIPKDRIREAVLVYLFKLFLTWLLGLTVVQLGLIEYPDMLIAKATNTSFISFTRPSARYSTCTSRRGRATD